MTNIVGCPSDKSTSTNPKAVNQKLEKVRKLNGLVDDIDNGLLAADRGSSLPLELTSDTTSEVTQARAPLFEDLLDVSVPGNVHLVSDASLERLIKSNGAVNLLRQMARDLAERDSQITEMRRRYEDKEKKLKNMLFDSGVSRTDVEQRLAGMLQRRPSRESIRSMKPRSEYSYVETLDDQLQEAMSEIDCDNKVPDYSPDSQSDTPKPRSSRCVSRKEQGSNAVRSPLATAPNSPDLQRSRRSSALSRWSMNLLGWDNAPRPTTVTSSFVEKTDKFPTASLLGSNRACVANRSSAGSSASSLAYEVIQLRKPSAADTWNISTMSESMTHSLQNKHWPNGGAPLHFQAITQSKSTLSQVRDSNTTDGGLVRQSASSTIFNLAHALVFDRHHDASTTTETSTEESNTQNHMEGTQLRGARRMDHLHARIRSMSAPRSQEPWVAPVLRETAQAVLPGVQKHLLHRNSTMELETFIPDAEQPPSMLPAWNDVSLQSHALTDRFGFKLPDARTKQRELSKQLFEDDSASDTVEKVQMDRQSPVSSQISLSDQSGGPRSEETASQDSRMPLSSGVLRKIQSINESVVCPRPLTPETSLNNSDAIFSNERSSARLHMLSQLDLYGADKAKQERWDTFLMKTRDDRRKGLASIDLNEDELIGLAGLGTGRMAKERRKELNLLVLGGIPMNYRPKIWGELTGACTLREPLYYQELLRHGKDVDLTCVAQIDLDIRRTMPSNVFFAGTGPGVIKLRRVLLAFSRHNPTVGYCQGMNVIAATLLLTHPTEEDVFFVLVSIVEKILPPRYFTPDLLTSRADQSVFKHLLREICPQSMQHLRSLSIDLEAITFGWFLSVFTDCMPAECLFRTWDIFFLDGHSWLFCVAISIMKVHEKALLDCDTPGQVYTLLKELDKLRDISIDDFVRTSEQIKMSIKTKGYDIQ